MKLSTEVKEVLSATRPISFATASKGGVPNVVPIGMFKIVDDETIWIVDNFMDKTLKNLKENPVASFYAYSKDFKESFQIKGKCVVENSGKDYADAVEFAHSVLPQAIAKNLIKMSVCKVYYVSPGPNAGKEL